MTDRLAWLPLRRRSIAVRLAVSSFLSSTAILVIAAFILTTLYRENTERAFDSRLLVFANNLATDLVSPSDPETRSFSLGDPRFDLPLSGWYWQVGRPDAKPRDLRTSRSLVGVPLKGPDQAGTATVGQIRQGYGRGRTTAACASSSATSMSEPTGATPCGWPGRRTRSSTTSSASASRCS
ncbi:hypothetical protein MSPGM_13340 [Methylorubrum sp. GM97]|nr:hypothetical protein MSPGM_13340 [Methylorubrum sp. GM97]